MRSTLTSALVLLIISTTLAQESSEQRDLYGRRALVRPSAAAAPDSRATRTADWTALGPYGGDVAAVQASPANPAIVLAGLAPDGSAGGTLYRSTDAGANWTEVLTLNAGSVYDIEFTPAGVAFIGTDDGVWRSTDGGATWVQLNLNVGLNDTVLEVAIHPTNAAHVWVGLADALGYQTQLVLRSLNGGASWTNVTPPLAASLSCLGLAFHPADPNMVYACFGGSFGGGACWVSSDYGASWVDRTAGLPANPLNDIVHDGTRVLVTGGQLFGSQNVGLYASTNDGVSWEALHDGSWPIQACAALAIHPLDPAVILLASLGAGMYHTNDGGITWTFGAGQTNGLSLNAVRFAPGDASVIYAGGSSVGVLKSTDTAHLFVPASVGIGALEATACAANPSDNAELALAFTALNSGGVYTSPDGGVSWNLEPVPGTRWSAVGFAPDGTLYAISDGPTSIAPEGFYRRKPDGTWESLGPDQGPYFESQLRTMRFSRHDPALILGGGSDFGVAGWEATIWRSPDGGDTWTKVHESVEASEVVTDIEILEDGTDLRMVASFNDLSSNPDKGGALLSADGGVTWAPSNLGLDSQAQCEGLALSPVASDTIYLADRGANYPGLYVSTDGGLTWSTTGYGEPILDIVSDANDPLVLYARGAAGEKVRRSTDGGVTFEPFGAGLEVAGWATALEFAAGADPRLLLATSTGLYARAVGCAGDANCDGVISWRDIDYFVAAQNDNVAAWTALFAPGAPSCPFANNDVNADGTVSWRDIDPLVAAMNTACP